MKTNNLALWAAASAFFATILAVGTIDIFNPNDQVRLLSSIVVGLLTGGAVFSKQKLDDAKKSRTQSGVINITEDDEKKIFSLELEGDPSTLEDKQEVLFKVNKIDQ